VKEVARCFTGWTIHFPGDLGGDYGTYKYEPLVHDEFAKVVLGQAIPGGGGELDGDLVLDLLASHPATARHIATKLCRRFLRDDPDTASVDAVAAAFSGSSGDIKTTLRALFATAAFRDTADQKFCRPTEFLAGTVRALAPDATYPTDNGLLFFYAQAILGQLPFYWPTPDGYPDEQGYWASTGGLLNRWRLSFLSFAPYIPEIDVFAIDYAALTAGATTIADLVDTLADTVLMRPLAGTDRTILIDWLVDETGYAAGATLPAGAPEQAAPLVAAVLLSSAYFQLR